jgi:hypothetical protein
METFPALMGPDPVIDTSPIVGGYYRGFCYQMVAFLVRNPSQLLVSVFARLGLCVRVGREAATRAQIRTENNIPLCLSIQHRPIQISQILMPCGSR